jgi:hypothetical protein
MSNLSPYLKLTHKLKTLFYKLIVFKNKFFFIIQLNFNLLEIYFSIFLEPIQPFHPYPHTL